MIDANSIAAPLRRVAELGDVPGVAAAAATADGVIFEGAFGTRDLATGAPMTTDTVVWIASMTKAITGACAMQLVERGQLSLDGDIANILPALGRVQVLEGFDADGTPRLRAPKRGHHLAPSAHPYLRPRLRHVECGHCPLLGGDRHTGHHLLPECRADVAAGIRPWREMGIRHRHRLGRQGGRGGLRPDARGLHARQHPRSARHDRHRLQDRCRATPAAGEDPRPHARRPGPDGYRNSAGAGIPYGRRRALRDGRGLPDVRADDHAGRYVERGPGVAAGDGGDDVAQRDGRTCVQSR